MKSSSRSLSLPVRHLIIVDKNQFLFRALRPHRTRPRTLSGGRAFRRRRLRRPLFRISFLDLADGGRVDGEVGFAGNFRWMRRSRDLRRAHRIRLHRRSFAGAHSARRSHGGLDRQRSGEDSGGRLSGEARAQSVSRDACLRWMRRSPPRSNW